MPGTSALHTTVSATEPMTPGSKPELRKLGVAHPSSIVETAFRWEIAWCPRGDLCCPSSSILGQVPGPLKVQGRASGMLGTFCLSFWVWVYIELCFYDIVTFLYTYKLHLNNAIQIILKLCNKCVLFNLPVSLLFPFLEQKT